MKKLIIFLFLGLIVIPWAMADNVRIEREDDSSGGRHSEGNENREGHHDRQGQHSRPTKTVITQSPSHPANVAVQHTRIVRQPGHPIPDHRAPVARETTIVRSMQNERRVEVVPNHAYWHTTGGVRYVHTYRGGVHWYGFYHGPNFYWTRYHRNRWWWYDPGFNHWVFWANGYWWWNGPSNVLYVYENDSYYPYDQAPVQVAAPPVAAPPSTATTVDTENNGGVWSSNDGRRMVQIQGSQSEAYLYDKSAVPPKYLAYLGSHVDRVRFSGGTDGTPQKILVDFKNGNFSLFSTEGEPLDLTPPEAPDASGDSVPTDAPPSPPTDIPN